MGAEADFSEAASENGEKRRRGRPRLFHPGELALIEAQFPEVKTERARQDRIYFYRAVRVLDYDPAFYWLVSNEEEIRSGGGRFRWSILAALGRMESDEDLKTVAQILCDRKPKAKEAAALVRRFRQKAGPPDQLALANIIIACINNYLARHPDMANQDVLPAVATVYDMVQKSEAASKNTAKGKARKAKGE